MAEKNERDRVFEDDEMSLMSINIHWTPEELLAREGVFFLKDVVKILPIDPNKIKNKAKDLADLDVDLWKFMGVRKVWNHWVVRMKVFGPYYRGNLVSKVRQVKNHWDGNTLLKQKGIFYLSQICKLIPFSTHQLRYQAKRHPNAKTEIGIYRDEEINSFVVDMERFAPWIRRLWQGKGKNKEG